MITALPDDSGISRILADRMINNDAWIYGDPSRADNMSRITRDRHQEARALSDAGFHSN